MHPLRLIFMGSPDFSVPVLAALLEAGHEVVCVYSQPPVPPAGDRKNAPPRFTPMPKPRGFPCVPRRA